MRNSIADDLRRIADMDISELDYAPDPLDPELSQIFADVLTAPMPIGAVEAVEQAAMGVFHRQLSAPSAHDAASARAFGDFFQGLGFLFKYKPYGVKIASPFGYSIFDLYPGRGFSFQLHVEPKYEAFHVLRAHPDSFVYLSSRPEWSATGEQAAIAWSEDGRELASRYSIKPKPGDVARIPSTDIVHSVTGCTLEEYATTSLDAVERLLDQNDRANMKLPARHPNVRELVGVLHPELPLRLLDRSESGWTCVDMTDSDPIIEVPGQMLGRRMRIDRGARFGLSDPAAWVNVIIPTTSAVRCAFAGREWTVSPGGLIAVPPEWEAEVSTDDSTVIALHSIAPELVLRKWLQ